MTRQNFTMLRGIRILFLLTGLFFCGAALPAQEPAKTAPPPAAPETTAYTRPCTANPVLPPPVAKKKSSRKSKHPLAPEPPPTCIEVKGEGIEIQEFLQNTAREQVWRIGENHASEDTWSYVRYLDVDELEKFADTKVLIEPVKFTSGKAAVVVRATDIGDGYARVQITTHIQGEGKSTDKTWAQPASVWPLNSNGVLEQELIKVLQTEYKPLQ